MYVGAVALAVEAGPSDTCILDSPYCWPGQAGIVEGVGEATSETVAVEEVMVEYVAGTTNGRVAMFAVVLSMLPS
eukprot:gene9462-32449_t